MAFRITTWPERAAPPAVAYGARVVAAAFAESEGGEPGAELRDSPDWVRRRVTCRGERTEVRVRAEIVRQLGDGVLDQLAEATGPDRIAGSAVFVDISGTRQPMRIGREYFLRTFVALSEAEQVDFVLRWGPLDVEGQPHDLWFTSLTPLRGSHLDRVDDLLNGAKWRHPADGRSFPLGPPEANLTLEGFAIELQDLAFRIYQAALVTLIEMVLADRPDSLRYGFDAAGLTAVPPRSVIQAWRRRNLPAPSTVAQALDTTIGVLLRGTRSSAPHLEVHAETDGEVPYWRLGRGILGAICLQAVHAVSDGVPVRPCARCGRLFQRQDEGGISERSQGTTRVRFCSDRCARAQAQQRYRERRRMGR